MLNVKFNFRAIFFVVGNIDLFTDVTYYIIRTSNLLPFSKIIIKTIKDLLEQFTNMEVGGSNKTVPHVTQSENK